MNSENRKIANKKYYEKRKLKLREETLNQDVQTPLTPPHVPETVADAGGERVYTFSESELRALIKNSSKNKNSEKVENKDNFFLPQKQEPKQNSFTNELLKSMALMSLPPLLKLALGAVGQKLLMPTPKPLPKQEPSNMQNTQLNSGFVYGF